MFLSKEFLISKFSEFKDKPDYQKHLKELESLSEIEAEGDLEGIPKIKEKPEILNFYKQLDGWGESDKETVKKICRMYFGKKIEDDRECLFYIEGMLNIEQRQDLIMVKDWLFGGGELDIEMVFKMVENEDIIINLISQYIIMELMKEK
jgi:hypothetical protein